MVYLGSKNGRDYFAGNDNYVWQFDSATHRLIGWFCSLPAWERTMHVILSTD